MTRKKIDTKTETEVLTNSKRRCALCYGINGDLGQKNGQIAHLDKNNSNNKFENLCWLCFDHHSIYDSISSQHKNYTINEVKKYRNDLYVELNKQNYDLIESNIPIVNKPYSLQFNGINGFLDYGFATISRKNNFILETLCKINNEYYAGVLFNLIDTNTKKYLYGVRYSSKHPIKPNLFEIKYRIEKDDPITLFTLNTELTNWATIILSINSEKYQYQSILLKYNSMIKI